MAVSKFIRGSATFPCDCCGRLTRDTGDAAYGVKLCRQCWELAGDHNLFLDGELAADEFNARRMETRADVLGKGASAAKFDAAFPAA